MRAGDTVVAVASPPGRSARAMVRVSGPGTRALIASVVPAGTKTAGPNACAAGVLLMPGAAGRAVEVPALISLFEAPYSYTGEDAAEIQVSGNPSLVERVVAALAGRDGVRQADPGEFTARAYLNRKLSLDQAEGVAAIVAATSQEQLDAARSLLEGRSGADYRRWADEVTTLLALVESGIDFTDQEDVVPIAPAALGRRIAALRGELGAQLGHAAGGEAGHALARVALVGRPNAGKSTLFNALLGRRRAVMSPLAGTTRDVLAEELDLSRDVPGAGAVLLEDLAGVDVECAGESRAVHDASQESARRAIVEADVLIWCDPAGMFEGEPVGPERAVIRVRTFGDRARPGGSREDVAVCALDGWQLGMLRRQIAEAATTSRAAGVAALLPRHRLAMTDAAASLGAAAESAGTGARLANPEVTAMSLRTALDALGELVGAISPDEVLGRVFATFCVGK